jgi:hypothetical protein
MEAGAQEIGGIFQCPMGGLLAEIRGKILEGFRREKLSPKIIP